LPPGTGRLGHELYRQDLIGAGFTGILEDQPSAHSPIGKLQTLQFWDRLNAVKSTRKKLTQSENRSDAEATDS